VNPASAATQADLQRLDPRRSRWISEQRRRVSRAGVATFRWKAVKGTTRLRVALLPLSLATGWAATESKPVTVRGM
jgi:hypothetical protein